MQKTLLGEPVGPFRECAAGSASGGSLVGIEQALGALVIVCS
jgi:hypothetical protein